MTKLLLALTLLGTKLTAATQFSCENSSYKLIISPSSQTAVVAHKTRPGTRFKTLNFQQSGSNFPRFTVNGEARALRYEETSSEQWYEGEALIRTSAKLIGDNVVYSAQFLIDYDPYYPVTTWTNCSYR